MGLGKLFHKHEMVDMIEAGRESGYVGIQFPKGEREKTYFPLEVFEVAQACRHCDFEIVILKKARMINNERC